MMKLTVAFLAALAAADAAQAHGRRHVRRQGYGYGSYPVAGESSYSLPGTGVPPVPSSSTPAVPESSKTPSPEESSSAPAVGTGSVVYPTGTAPSGETGVPYPSAPEGTGSVPSFPTTAPPAYPTGPAGNGTEMTTSTIYSTQTFTITQCPSTVVDCPAESTKTVTSTVPVGVTVCPKETPAAETPSGEIEVIETPVSEITHTVTETLTYTVGTGPSAHPTTKEITSTSTETIYATITITKDGSSPVTGVPYGGDEITGTVTSTTTSTTTKYITVHPTGTPVEGENTPSPTGPAGGPGGEEGEGECAPPVTVTVTDKETVTVTAYPSSSSPADAVNTPISTGAGETHVPAYPTGPAPSAPYPAPGNGTVPYPTGSTGFVTYTKPYPTSEVPVYSSLPADSQLPSFTLPAEEEEVSSTPYPEETPAPTTAPAYPGYGYGR